MATMIPVTSELARACGSTGWVAGLLVGSTWTLSQLSDRAQRDVFGQNPDALVCTVFTPSGSAQRVPGGYKVSGSWGFGTGSLHADWVLAVSPLLDESGQMVNVGVILMPISDVAVQDTWFTVGMRGTGSNSIVAEEVMVAEHRVHPLMGADGAMDATPSNEFIGDEPVYRVPIGALAGLAIIGPPLGLAKAALETARSQLHKRSIAFSTYDRQAEAPTSQLRLGEAASMIDAAELLIGRAAADADRIARDDEAATLLERVRIRSDIGYATRLLRNAGDLLITVTGASSMADTNPLSRIFRDLATCTLHGILNPDLTLEMYGRTLLGLEPHVSGLF